MSDVDTTSYKRRREHGYDRQKRSDHSSPASKHQPHSSCTTRKHSPNPQNKRRCLDSRDHLRHSYDGAHDYPKPKNRDFDRDLTRDGGRVKDEQIQRPRHQEMDYQEPDRVHYRDRHLGYDRRDGHRDYDRCNRKRDYKRRDWHRDHDRRDWHRDHDRRDRHRDDDRRDGRNRDHEHHQRDRHRDYDGRDRRDRYHDHDRRDRHRDYDRRDRDRDYDRRDQDRDYDRRDRDCDYDRRDRDRHYDGRDRDRHHDRRDRHRDYDRRDRHRDGASRPFHNQRDSHHAVHHTAHHKSQVSSSQSTTSGSSGGASSNSDSCDDNWGHIDAPAGMTLGAWPGTPAAPKPKQGHGRYEVVREAGKGTFGLVFACIDHAQRQREDSDKHVAIKIVRRVRRYTESAEIEVRILRRVNAHAVECRRATEKHSPAVKHAYVQPDESLCVRLLDDFMCGPHKCLVFEALGPSLYDWLKQHDYTPFPTAYVRAFARQLLQGVAFLHSLDLAHTDLKLENVLLVDGTSTFSPAAIRSRGENGTTSMECAPTARREVAKQVPACAAIKLIDFGGATFMDEHKSSTINTRQYRAPEVILGLGWGLPSDVWSVACMIMELYTGSLFFATHDNLEHIALMQRRLGSIPRTVLRALLQRSQRHAGVPGIGDEDIGGDSHRDKGRDSSSSSSCSRARSGAQYALDKYFTCTTLGGDGVGKPDDSVDAQAARLVLRWPSGASSERSVEHVACRRTLQEIIEPCDDALGMLELLRGLFTFGASERTTAAAGLAHRFCAVSVPTAATTAAEAAVLAPEAMVAVNPS